MNKTFYFSAGFLAVLVTDAMAAKNYSLRPIIDASVHWDSNYYYDHTDEVAVYTYLIQPGLQFNYQGAQTQFEFEGTLDGHAYSGSSTPDDFIGCTIKGDVRRTTLSRQLAAGLRDRLAYTRDPENLGKLETVASRELYKTNSLNPYLEYDLDRFKLDLEYSNTVVSYDEADKEDTALDKGSIQALYKPNRTIEFGPALEFEAMNYDQDSPDYQGVKLTGNLVRKGKFVILNGGLGYHKRELDDEEQTELDAFSWQIGVASQASGFKKTRFSLLLLGDLNDTTTPDGYYSTLQLNGVVERSIVKNITLGLHASYKWNDYELIERKDDIWKTGATVAYTVTDWLKISSEAGLQRQDSTEDENDNDNSYWMLKLSYTP